VIAAGAWGVAVIGAISDAPDPHSATHEMMLAVAKAVEALGGAPA
jgi:thiamine monophosphate synthase